MIRKPFPSAYILKILLLTSIVISLNFLIWGSHPVLVSLMLAATSLAAAAFSGRLVGSWFFYLLILVFLGGVIVLIVYMSTLCTNEKFSSLKKIEGICLFLFFVLACTSYASYTGRIGPAHFNPSLLFESNQRLSLTFLIRYLFIALICIVKLVKFESGPLIKRL